MKVKSEVKRIEEELKVSSRHEVDGNAAVFELSLDELSYVAGGCMKMIVIDSCCKY